MDIPLFPAVTFLIALAFGFLAMISKNVWQDKKRTRECTTIAIIATLAFMTWVWFFSDLE